MNTTEPKKLEPLSKEEIKAVEENNGLLKIFAQWFEGLEKLPELQGVKLDGAMMFQAFTVGCSAVMRIQQHATMKVAIETQQLNRLLVTLATMQQGESNETE